MSVHTVLDLIEDQVDQLTRAAVAPPGCDPPPGQSGEAVLRLGVVVERLAALRAVWSEQFEAGQQWKADGARSGSTWLAARAIEHPSAPRGRITTGRDLRTLPQMAAAALRGEARIGHIRLLAAAARSKPHRLEALAAVEDLATRTAATVTEPQFARFVQRWAALADAEHDAKLRAEGLDVPVTDHADAEQSERRELFLSRYGTDGLWALSGTLDTETGLALSAALESVCEAIRNDDTDRSLAQLRHDALAALLSGELSAGLPVHKGVRPHLMIINTQGGTLPSSLAASTEPGATGGTETGGTETGGTQPGATGGTETGGTQPGTTQPSADLPGTTLPGTTLPGEALPSTTLPSTTLPSASPATSSHTSTAYEPAPGPSDLGAPSSAELLDRGDGTQGALWLSGHARQRLTCDATAAVLTVDRNGVPLHLGRTVRVVPPALRRVIDLRDRHCTFAGCTAPAIWCQAHHLVHWEDGGPTDERNLALICQFHHKAIHERGFTLQWAPDGTHLQTLRPDRTVISVPASRGGQRE